MCKTEAKIQKEIQARASELGGRLFRNNSGKAWVGKIHYKDKDVLVLKNYRIFHAGMGVGTPDLVGWTENGKFLGVEVKKKHGRVSKFQERFISVARSFGCIVGVCRSTKDLEELLNEA